MGRVEEEGKEGGRRTAGVNDETLQMDWCVLVMSIGNRYPDIWCTKKIPIPNQYVAFLSQISWYFLGILSIF